MKYNLLLILCLSSASLLAQTDGITPVLVGEGNETRALVIGISDYRDTAMNDLQYAHKDAEIFAKYLQSQAGGALPDQNIWLMTNSEATLGAIDNALDWLVRETRKGDKVIIYFSGHGSVEKLTLWQRGYLLAYSTPAHNFRNNAVRVEDLDEIIKTLSVGKEAKVVVILDACRAGKLANAGPNLTSEQLEKQVENEVRILSCKSDQKSLESNAWGQGRGLFSFYMINGLKGLADRGPMPDGTVTFAELNEFVQDSMESALKNPRIKGNYRQNPVFVGDETYELAQVTPEVLAEANQDLGLVAMSSPRPVQSGNDRGILEKSPDAPKPSRGDASASFLQSAAISEMAEDPGFSAAVEANDPAGLLRFFTQKIQVNDAADAEGKAAFLAAVERSENNAALRQQLQQLLAARLHDEAQEAVSDYLSGDAGELDKRHYIDQADKYLLHPLMLRAALQLLPKDHLLYRSTEVKFHYFDGVCTRLAGQMSEAPMSRVQEALAKQKKALALDDKAAYIHNEIGLLYLMLADWEKAKQYFQQAADLAPEWALPPSNLCIVFGEMGQLDKAKASGEKAIALQPGYFGSYVNLGNLAQRQHDYLAAETLYRKARSLNDPHYLPYEQRAKLLLESTRYKEADWQFYEMELRKQGTVAPISPIYVAASPPVFAPKDFKYPSLSRAGVLYESAKTAEEHFLSGKYYYEQSMLEKALPHLEKAMRLAPDHLEVYYYLGDINLQMKQYEAAEIYFSRLIKLRPEVEFMPLFLAKVYQDWQRPADEEAIYKRLINKSKDKDILENAYTKLASLLEKQGRYSELELLNWDFYAVDPRWAQLNLAIFYEKMVKAYPESMDWHYRLADFNYKYSRRLQGILDFEELLKKDSSYVAAPFIHALVGTYYLKEGFEPKLYETQANWAGSRPYAIAHLRKAVELSPSLPSAKYELAQALASIFEYDEALAVLAGLRDSNDLNFDSRLRYADLLMRAGQFAEAKKLLDKAWEIQPNSVPGLPELTGKWHLLQGETGKAIEFYKQEIQLTDAKQQGNLCYTVARLYAKAGKMDDAMQWLQKAGENGFDCPMVMKYDTVLNSMKHKIDFVEVYQKVSARKQYDKED